MSSQRQARLKIGCTYRDSQSLTLGVAIRLSISDPRASFAAAAIRIREQRRALAGRSATRGIGSTLLLKGLESDHAILRDVTGLDANNLFIDATETIDARFDVRGFVWEANLILPTTPGPASLPPFDRTSESTRPQSMDLPGRIGDWRRKRLQAGATREIPRQRRHCGVRVYKDGPEAFHATWAAEDAPLVGGSIQTDPFRALVSWMRLAAYAGRTSNVKALDRYFNRKDDLGALPVTYYPKPDSSAS